MYKTKQTKSLYGYSGSIFSPAPAMKNPGKKEVSEALSYSENLRTEKLYKHKVT